MLRRLFALLILVALVGVGAALWWRGDHPEAVGEVPELLRDVAVTGAVEAALHLNRHLRPYDIEVRTRGGSVTLRGEVPDEELRARAAEIAAAVPRVERVRNDLEVVPGAAAPEPVERSLGEALDDRALAMRVQLAFTLNRRLEGVDLQVSAYRGELTLSGEVVEPDQRALALAIAGDTPGVTGVTDRVRVAGDSALSATAARVEGVLADSPHLEPYGIRVSEEEGRLVLLGRVGTSLEKELAGSLAREAAAGRPVDNRLEVRP